MEQKAGSSSERPPEETAVAIGRRGTRYSRGEEARRRILDLAWRAFADRGFHGASMNEIAKSAGLSMAGLIHHFPNKVELFSAVLREREADEAVRFFGALGYEPTAEHVLDAFVAMAALNSGRYSFVQLTHLVSAESARGNHPATEFTRRHYQQTRTLLASALARGIEAGQVRAEVDPHRVALQVTAMIEGLENQWLHETECIDLAQTFGQWVSELKSQIFT